MACNSNISFFLSDDGKGPAPVKRAVTEAKDFFRKNHGIVSLEAGTLMGTLRQSIGAMCTDQTTTDRLIDGIVTKMDRVMNYMNQCRRWMHWSIELFISDSRTTKADLVELMNSSRNSKIVFWIGRYLSQSPAEVNSADESYPLSKRIVIGAYKALGITPGTALLEEMPTGSLTAYNDLVQFVVTEYTRFFKQGEERLQDQVIFRWTG